MIRMKWYRYLCLAVVLAAAAVLFTACKAGKYQQIDLPTVETVEADIEPTTEDPASVMTAIPEQTAESSTKDADKTTETAPKYETVDETVYVTGNKVNFRKGSSSDSEVLAALDLGTEVKRTGVGEVWSRVVYKDQEGYISSSYLSKEKPEPKAGSGKLVAIDAGHQAKGNPEKEPIGPGSETKKAKVASGATGVSTGLPEYKLTLAVSKKLKAELELRGYQAVMIRETDDVNISNAERAEIANKSGADIFVRVHGNSLNDSSVHGVLTMCQTSKNPYNGNLYAQSSSLSKKVAASVSAATGFKNKGVQETDTMSGINWCKTPVTIVEMGFMSNPEEDKKMATDEYQTKIAKGIADGIDAYYAAKE